ncbi:Integrase catalytic domain-containing protein [Abeliophyllum distichum]|uniref:Integrase catalytic domain-containing protein n=1 Tax=Abeliophyllum distichum TaxID=126358 RepID=A0ABD1V7K0_9LAMI
MKGILVQQKVSKAINKSFPDTMSDDQRVEVDELAYTSIILHLSDSVLEKIDPSKDLDENFDIFNKLIQDIKNCGDKGIDEYKAIILLNSIPEAYKDVKSAIKYGRDDLTVDMIINALRNNGLEFCNKAFDDFCNQSGIKRHKTVPYSPQQNGVTERMNRTLLERVRCMLTCSGLSKPSWCEAVVTACYLANRSPSAALSGKTPEEIWHGKPTNLRIFCCTIFSHLKDDKLDPRSQKYVFLGYPERTKVYRLWVKNLGGFKTIVNRDVVLKEDKFPCSKQTTETNDNSNPTKTEIEVEPDNVVITPTEQDSPEVHQHVVSNDDSNYNQIRNEN